MMLETEGFRCQDLELPVPCMKLSLKASHRISKIPPAPFRKGGVPGGIASGLGLRASSLGLRPTGLGLRPTGYDPTRRPHKTTRQIALFF